MVLLILFKRVAAIWVVHWGVVLTIKFTISAANWVATRWRSHFLLWRDLHVRFMVRVSVSLFDLMRSDWLIRREMHWCFPSMIVEYALRLFWSQMSRVCIISNLLIWMLSFFLSMIIEMPCLKQVLSWALKNLSYLFSTKTVWSSVFFVLVHFVIII
jgi:hypothetical protein